MMVLLSVGLVLLMVGVLIITICFSAALSIMPYISGALISLVVSTEVPFAKGIVPDHPFMNYCLILIIVEVIIAALMRVKWTGRTTALCFSEIMVGIISMFILYAMKPDSIGYCGFITLVYLVGNLVFLTTNSSKYASEDKPVPTGIIISTLMYVFAAYFILAIPAELLWQTYNEQTYPFTVYCGHDLKIKIKVNEHMKRVGVSVYFKKMYILEKGYLYPKSKIAIANGAR